MPRWPGHVVSLETREKLRANVLGKSPSPEAREKLRVAGTGRKHTPEAIEKMRVAARGNTKGRANRGKIQSEEQKRAHSERMTGRTHSAETRAKMSSAQKTVWDRRTPEQLAEFFEKRQAASFKPTKIERWLHDWLDQEGVAFVIHPWVRVEYGGVKRVLRPDVLLPAFNLVVEVQGCYWHGCFDCYGEKARIDRIIEDELRFALMQEQGYKVFALWECDIKSGAAPRLVQSIIDQAAA
jgi:G:T-mismatch repair DNA endonuclease (very short patch repair protein)